MRTAWSVSSEHLRNVRCQAMGQTMAMMMTSRATAMVRAVSRARGMALMMRAAREMALLGQVVP